MRLVIGIALVLAGLAMPATAQYRHMNWNDYPGDHDISLPCAQLPDTSSLVIAFSVRDTMTVQRIEAALDFCTLPVPLPEWWRFDLDFGCRDSAMTVSTDFAPDLLAQQDPWAGTSGVSASLEFIPGWNNNEGLARVNILLVPDEPVVAQGGVLYYACRIQFTNTGDGTDCAGCDLPACFVLNSLTVFESENSPGLWTVGGSTYATWHEAPLCPFIVPVEATTWGAVKSQYR